MSVTNTNKQTIVCMKKNKHNELNMSQEDFCPQF